MFKYLKHLLNFTFKQILKFLHLKNKEKSLEYFCQISTKLKSSQLKQSTIENKKYLHKTLFSILKNTKITEFNKEKAYYLLTKLKQKSLKQSTIKQILSYANEGLNLAIDFGIITKNPLKNLNKFLKNKSKIKINKTIKQSHIKKLLNKATGELKIFLYFAFYTGARASEILAITNKDINYKKNYISINKNATRYGLTSPKNGNFRNIPLADILKQELEKINFKKFNVDYFTIYYQFKKLKKSLNLKIGSLHSIRHTYASNCLHLKIDLPIIAKNLGHNDITMLSRVYSHEIFSIKENKKLRNLFYFK
ncbi:site-specific integrase [Campylobacter sp. MG1]|uniref:site-specific integrase n=1 Tax=Campylobacter sp. MG1 TaxID=2976332 RepID=UPI00226C88FA|nr:site-specific integrase [Campylobacter sp. MG1]